jgi:tetratricopeptide (TPR) repeat protein
MKMFNATPARTVGAVTLAVVALSATATFLTRYYDEARQGRAEAHLERGQALAGSGNLRDAIVELRAALTLNRHDPAYALTLATALLDNNLPREAEPYLDEAIAADPTSGPANLARARAATTLGAPDATTYYRRAYFGSWPIDQQAKRLAAGFDLVEQLLAIRDRERARGMLAQIAVDAARDADAQLRVAQLLVRAGAPQDAEPLLRDLVGRRPGDEAAWSALARVAFDRHEYALAIDAAERWLELKPKNEEAETLMSVAREVRALDPSGPRLSAHERARRAQLLLRQTADVFDACASAPGPARADASKMLDGRSSQSADDEQLVDLAMRLWADRQQQCPPANADTDVLAHIFSALAAKDDRP